MENLKIYGYIREFRTCKKHYCTHKSSENKIFMGTYRRLTDHLSLEVPINLVKAKIYGYTLKNTECSRKKCTHKNMPINSFMGTSNRKLSLWLYRSSLGRQGCLAAHSYECFALDYRRPICVLVFRQLADNGDCHYTPVSQMQENFYCFYLLF